MSIFSKSTQTRLTETRDFIDQFTGLPPLEVGRVVTLVDNYIAANWPRTTAAQRNAYNDFSNRLSMVNVANSGSEVQRSCRRAIILLQHAMFWRANAGPPQDEDIAPATNVAAGEITREFAGNMVKALCVASNAGANYVFQNILVAAPVPFLQRHPLMIFGVTHGANKVTAPGFGGPYTNPYQFCFYYDVPNKRFMIRDNNGAPAHGSDNFQAASVVAAHWADVPTRGNVPLPPAAGQGFDQMRGIDLSGEAYMVTTQFTGCSFCWMTAGAQTMAAHISPSSPVSPHPAMTGGGPALALQLMGNNPNVTAADFANWPAPGGAAPPMNIFGMGQGNAAVPGGNSFYPLRGMGAGQINTMVIFGIFGPHWRFYSQSVDVQQNIVEARQIL